MRSRLFIWMKWLGIVAIVLFVSLLFLRNHLFVVRGSNMEPTYGDYTFGFIWRYSNTFERFDVVLYKRRQDLTNISRIVGLPGEKVEIKEGALFIDGNRLDMSRYWINQPKAFGRFTLTLAPDQYALLSDNGHDGEATRLVTAGMIVGTFVYLPLGQ